MDESLSKSLKTVVCPVQMSKSQRDTLLQGTFNATLSNPLSEDQTAQKASAGKKRTAFVIGV